MIEKSWCKSNINNQKFSLTISICLGPLLIEYCYIFLSFLMALQITTNYCNILSEIRKEPK